MAHPETRAIQILGGRALLKSALRKGAEPRKRGAARESGKALTVKVKGKRTPVAEGAEKVAVSRKEVVAPHLEPGELGWTGLIRSGLPAKSTQSLAGTLGVSVTDLAASLRLPARTVHRRLEKGEALTPEESERNVRAARILAKAQDLLGDENGRGWVLSPCRGLGGEVPITLLDTADGFTAVMDELGRLEHGVIS